jgi:hypothetical protein
VHRYGVAWVWGCNEGEQLQPRGGGSGGGCFLTPVELRSIHPAAGAGVTAIAAGYRFTAVVLREAAAGRAAAGPGGPGAPAGAGRQRAAAGAESDGGAGGDEEDDGESDTEVEAEVEEEGEAATAHRRSLHNINPSGGGGGGGGGGRVLFLGSFLGAATSDDAERKAHVVRPHEELLAAANWRYQLATAESEAESGHAPMGLGGAVQAVEFT